MGRHGKILTRALAAPAFAAVLLLAGCADRVEFHGKIFEAMGLDSIDRNKSGPKNVATRAPLVVPPNKNLPPPGPPQQAVAAAEQSWPQDPDEQIRQAELERKRKQQEYYEKGDWSGEGGIDEFEKLVKPHERRPGVLGDLDVKDENREEEFRQKKAEAEAENAPPAAATEGDWSTETQQPQP